MFRKCKIFEILTVLGIFCGDFASSSRIRNTKIFGPRDTLPRAPPLGVKFTNFNYFPLKNYKNFINVQKSLNQGIRIIWYVNEVKKKKWGIKAPIPNPPSPPKRNLFLNLKLKVFLRLVDFRSKAPVSPTACIGFSIVGILPF